MTIYAGIDDEDFVVVQIGLPDPEGFFGPPDPEPAGPYRYEQIPEKVFGSLRPTPTSLLMWVDGAAAWVECGVLSDLQAKAIAKTYIDVDSVYDAAVGRRTTEYARAEEAARAFQSPDFTGPVSGYISGHAASNPTGQVQTNEWAAQQIVERADAFKWAELQMRNVRFARQADMRAATTPAELSAAVASWENFIAWLRSLLGV